MRRRQFLIRGGSTAAQGGENQIFSMAELSERQVRLLRAIVQEYVKSAEPVGSEAIVEKYDLGVSPATVRNEMVTLSEEGYLEKPHTSAGRIPTHLGFRYFVKNLMEEKEIPVVSEVAIRQRLWPQRHDASALLQSAVQALAEETKNLSVATTDEGSVYSAGTSYILRHPEFYDIDLTRTVLELIDEYEALTTIFAKIPEEQEFAVLLGSEFGWESLSPCGLVLCRVNLPRGRRGHLGILGPARLDYSENIPMVRFLSRLVNELCRSW